MPAQGDENVAIVFTSMPGPGEDCVFVEVEDAQGASMKIGRWEGSPDGLVRLWLNQWPSDQQVLAATKATLRPVEWGRRWDELSSAGLLWLINRVCFHPWGLCLVMHVEQDVAVGWTLRRAPGVFAFTEKQDDEGFAQAQKTINACRLLP